MWGECNNVQNNYYRWNSSLFTSNISTVDSCLYEGDDMSYDDLMEPNESTTAGFFLIAVAFFLVSLFLTLGIIAFFRYITGWW